MDDSFNIDDDELLQWLINSLPPPPPSPPPQQPPQQPPQYGGGGSQPPSHNNNNVDTFVTGAAAAGSSGGKGEQRRSNKKAVENERRRRQEISALYRSIRSILPAEYIRGKRSTAEHLQETVRYIKDMEDNIAKLNKKRDTLLESRGSSSNNNNNININKNNNNNININKYNFSVKKCREGLLEIILKTNGENYEENVEILPISKGIRVLSRKGFCIINTISMRVGNDVVHTIHVEVEEGMMVDQNLMEQQLIDCYISIQ